MCLAFRPQGEMEGIAVLQLLYPESTTAEWLFPAGVPSDRSLSLGWKKKPPFSMSLSVRELENRSKTHRREGSVKHPECNLRTQPGLSRRKDKIVHSSETDQSLLSFGSRGVLLILRQNSIFK